MALTRSHLSHTARKASWVTSSASCVSPVISTRAPKSPSRSASKNAWNVRVSVTSSSSLLKAGATCIGLIISEHESAEGVDRLGAGTSRTTRWPNEGLRLSGAFLRLLGGLVLLAPRNQRGVHPGQDDLLVDQALGDVLARGQLVHHVEQHLFQDGPEATRPGASEHALVGDRLQGIVPELELHSVELEKLLVLLDQRVLRLGEDVDQGLPVEVVHIRDHRQASNELGDQPVLQQVFGKDMAEDLAEVLLLEAPDVGAKPHALAADAALDDPLQAGEGAPADEQDVRGVDLDELLVRMLPAALRRHGGGGPLQDLQQGLLDSLTGDVTGDRRVLALASDLVDLVDVDDPGLGLLDVVVGRLDQLEQDVLDVLTDVSSLGEGGGVGNGKGNVQHAGQGLSQQRLAAPRWAEQNDVGLLQLDLVVLRAHLDPLVVVVHGYGQDLLGLLLADDVVVQEGVDLDRLGELVELQLGGFGELLLDDLVAEIDAFVADVDAGAGDQLLDLLLGLPAEGALEEIGITELRHAPLLPSVPSRARSEALARFAAVVYDAFEARAANSD